jgi:2-C-methyl-D-erythritol 4-phosphate cytidylyltransferase
VAKFAVILPAAGKSSRYKDENYKKPFAVLDGRAVWLHSADKFLNREDVCQVILVIAPEDREYFDTKFAANVAISGIDVVEGGAARSDSVRAGLAVVRPEAKFVAIHDAARPCFADAWVDKVFKKALKTGAAMLAISVTGTLKRVGANKQVEETVSRERLWEAQTPQVFHRQLLLDAYKKLGDRPATDDAQVVEEFGHAVHIVPGSALNLKITTKQDLRRAAAHLKMLPKPKLKGTGNPFDGADDFR